jgi:hypothetical protein
MVGTATLYAGIAYDLLNPLELLRNLIEFDAGSERECCRICTFPRQSAGYSCLDASARIVLIVASSVGEFHENLGFPVTEKRVAWRVAAQNRALPSSITTRSLCKSTC